MSGTSNLKNLTYTLPILGWTTVPLYGGTVKIFEALEIKEIHRLKSLNQLGIISDVIQTAHHPKYEYLFFLLYLIEQIKQIKGVYPLNREIVEDFTGAELLKTWAVLLSIGHLPGTFPVEKSVLKCFFNHCSHKEKFFKRVEDAAEQRYINEIIQSQNFYRFHHALAFAKLHRYRVVKKNPAFTSALKCLRQYCFYTADPSLISLKALFKRLRLFSCVVLDSYYTGSPNLFKISDLHKIAISFQNSHFDALLRAMNVYLIKEIYKNKNCRLAELILYLAHHEALERSRTPLAVITNRLYERDDSIVFQLYQSYKRKHKVDEMIFDEPARITSKNPYIFRQEGQMERLSQKLQGIQNEILFDVDQLPEEDHLSVGVFITKGQLSSSAFLPNFTRGILAAILRNESVKYNEMKKYYRPGGGAEEDPYYAYGALEDKRRINQENFRSFLLTILRIIFNEKVGLIKFTSKSIFPVPDFYYEVPPFLSSRLPNIEDHELQQLISLMSCLHGKNKNRSYVVVTANILLEKDPSTKGNLTIGEFDGALLAISKNEICLYMLEAKKGKQLYSQARKQLKNLKKYLKDDLRRRNASRICRMQRGKPSAYLKVNLQNHGNKPVPLTGSTI